MSYFLDTMAQNKFDMGAMRERQIDRQTERQRDRETERQRDRQTDRQAGRQAYRQTDRHTQTDTQGGNTTYTSRHSHVIILAQVFSQISKVSFQTALAAVAADGSNSLGSMACLRSFL